MDRGIPSVRKLGAAITWRQTEEAKQVAALLKKKPAPTPTFALEQDQVHRQAEAAAKERGLQNPTKLQLQGFYQLQLGQYKGQSFRWLAENDMGYATYLAEGDHSGSGALNVHKRQLKYYLTSFPDGRAAIEQRKREAKKAEIPTPQSSHTKLRTTPTPVTQPEEPLMEGEIDDSQLLSQVQEVESSQGTSSQVAPLPLSSVLQQADKYPLPEGWRDHLPQEDIRWISTLCHYNKQGKVDFCPTQLWHHPPPPPMIPAQIPRPDRYFSRRLFVWFPRRFFKVQLFCPDSACKRSELTSAGLYRNVRRVVDVSDFYHMVTEYLRCPNCGKKVIAWSAPIVQQLDEGHRRLFPAILTYQLACDIKVVTLMATRGLGNSASQLQHKLEELHRQHWLTQVTRYLSDCRGFTDARMVTQGTIAEPPTQLPVPKFQWLQTVYCLDVMSRVEEVKAAITSTFGTVIKMDSTKKIVRKLAGHAHKTASWSTNVGNEHGQVLMSVLTCNEGHDGLGPMVSGLIQRYTEAGVEPPNVLYVDKECCGNSFTRRLFSAWPDLAIRLDIWHFMRRFSSGCSTDAHQLYGVFMSRLSKCIFEWSAEDLQQLKQAKRTELQRQHVEPSSMEDILPWLTKRELALHCRRRTRGFMATTDEIEKLIDTFKGEAGLDTLGVPLFDNEKMDDIWKTQKTHVACIQDPDNISLYTQIGTVKKGSVTLKSYRCARGSTSLESFHLHINRFIPGNSASAAHFQAYLLEGLRRWNEDRHKQATDSSTCTSYSGLLQHAVNDLSESVLSKKLVADYQQPRKYTGEKIGVEYLFSQTGKVLQNFTSDEEGLREIEEATAVSEDEESSEDEGFDEVSQDDPTQPPVDPLPLFLSPSRKRTAPAISPDNTADTEATQQPDLEDSSELDDADGFVAVDNLAQYLLPLRDQTSPITNPQADRIVELWQRLSRRDHQPSVPKPRHQTRLTKCSATTFKMRSKPSCVPGVDSVKRAFHGTEGGVATWPDVNRIMELLVIKLCAKFPTPVKRKKRRIDRWGLVSEAYRHIRELVLDCTAVMTRTNITLFAINNATLSQWYKVRTASQEQRMLEQNIRLAEPRMVADTSLPPPVVREPPIQPDPEQLFKYTLQPITVGKAKVRRRLQVEESPANPDSTLVRTETPMRPIVPKPSTDVASAEPLPAMQTSSETVARSTQWYRDRQEKKKASGKQVKENTRRRANYTFTCSKCGQPRTGDHKQYYGQWYCPSTVTESFEEWRAVRAQARLDKKAEQK